MAEQVVAMLRVPVPVSAALIEATQALQRLYGKDLVLLPFGPGDEFASLATVD